MLLITRLHTVSTCSLGAWFPDLWKEFHLSFPAGGQLWALGGLPNGEEVCVTSTLNKQCEWSGVRERCSQSPFALVEYTPEAKFEFSDFSVHSCGGVPLSDTVSF